MFLVKNGSAIFAFVRKISYDGPEPIKYWYSNFNILTRKHFEGTIQANTQLFPNHVYMNTEHSYNEYINEFRM
jgi:hypothetical protein